MSENAHDKKRLRELQALPLSRKIVITKMRVAEFVAKMEEVGKVPTINFSGGKDSCLLIHLIRQDYPDMPAVFCDTGLEFPEIRQFAMSFDNVDVIRPKMRFDEVVKTHGWCYPSKDIAMTVDYYRRGSPWAAKYFQGMNTHGEKSVYTERIYKPWDYLKDCPFNISHRCCVIMKESPIERYNTKHKAAAIVGTMADESKRREDAWIKTGCNSFDKGKEMCRPISFWTEQDVLRYLKEFEVPYCSVYGDIVEDENGKLKTTGQRRTGCIFCPIGCHLDNPNNFQRLKETHPKQWSYVINELKLGEFLDYLKIPYGKDFPLTEE